MSLSNLINNIDNHFKLNDDLKNANYLLESYKNNDWMDYKSTILDGYKKKLVYRSNLYEIYIIIWKKNSFSPIHNHPKGGCLMKILEGSLKEDIYDKNIKIKNQNYLVKNNVKYIDDKIGYHKILNNYNSYTYSIHIYSPINFITQKFDV